jgi:hypothetical protein
VASEWEGGLKGMLYDHDKMEEEANKNRPVGHVDAGFERGRDLNEIKQSTLAEVRRLRAERFFKTTEGGDEYEPDPVDPETLKRKAEMLGEDASEYDYLNNIITGELEDVEETVYDNFVDEVASDHEVDGADDDGSYEVVDHDGIKSSSSDDDNDDSDDDSDDADQPQQVASTMTRKKLDGEDLNPDMDDFDDVTSDSPPAPVTESPEFVDYNAELANEDMRGFKAQPFMNNRFTSEDDPNKVDFDSLDPEEALVQARFMARSKNNEWLREGVHEEFMKKKFKEQSKHLIGSFADESHLIDPAILKAAQPAIAVFSNIIKVLSYRDGAWRFRYFGPMRHKRGMEAWLTALMREQGNVKCTGVWFETGARKTDFRDNDLGGQY